MQGILNKTFDWRLGGFGSARRPDGVATGENPATLWGNLVIPKVSHRMGTIQVRPTLTRRWNLRVGWVFCFNLVLRGWSVG